MDSLIDIAQDVASTDDRPALLLPPHIRVLFVSGAARRAGWLAEAFASDSASEVSIEEVRSMAAGLSLLRDESFDVVLVSHENDLDAFELLDGLRGSGVATQAVIVFGEQPAEEMSALCYEAGADAYLCLRTTDTRTLLWTIARAMERHKALLEMRRLEQAQEHRLQLDRDEASNLLHQQHTMLHECEQSADSESSQTWDSTGALRSRYKALLQAYVIMGSGGLSTDAASLACRLVCERHHASQVMRLHLDVVEEMIAGLGNRSSRHVLNRANLLLVEMMMRLAELYGGQHDDVGQSRQAIRRPERTSGGIGES